MKCAACTGTTAGKSYQIDRNTVIFFATSTFGLRKHRDERWMPGALVLGSGRATSTDNAIM